jgi:hypothetical protein
MSSSAASTTSRSFDPVPERAGFLPGTRRDTRGVFVAARVVRVDFVRFTAMLTSSGWGYSNLFRG